MIRHAQEVSGSVAKTCRYYGVSRPTYYKWLRRNEELDRGTQRPATHASREPNALSVTQRSQGSFSLDGARLKGSREGGLGMDKVVHFEIPVDDEGRAKEFYASAFDWQLDDNDMGGGNIYTTATTVAIDEQMRPKEPGAINGGIMKRSSQTPTPVITIGVDSIDDALKKIEAGGGSTITPRTPIPDMGAFAYFKDSEGNTMGLWESAI
jgi:predicted enzyme related to lactoylglutathione lyase